MEVRDVMWEEFWKAQKEVLTQKRAQMAHKKMHSDDKDLVRAIHVFQQMLLKFNPETYEKYIPRYELNELTREEMREFDVMYCKWKKTFAMV